MSDPIKDATCWLLLKKPWYGTFVSMIRWRENDQCPSMGVCIRRDGTVAGVWNAEFVKRLTRKELATVLMHEADHVIRLHTVRRLDRWPELWNVAADMVINGPKDNPHLVIEGECHLPTFPPTEPGGKPISCVYNKFDPAWTTEEVFNALKKESKICSTCGAVVWSPDGAGEKQGSKSQGQQKGGKKKGKGGQLNPDGTCPTCGSKPSPHGVIVDDHGVWKEGTTPEEARRVVASMVDQANKMAGTVPGHLAEAIKRLEEVKFNPASALREYLGKKAGGRRLCNSRPNRRTTIFGVSGHTSRALCDVTIIVDVSGSIGKQELAEFFGIIERFASRFRKMTLVQFDVGITSVKKYRRGDWHRIKAEGRGGTDLCLAMKQAEERGLVSDVNLVLTDGYLTWPDPKPYPILWALCSTTNVQPKWGKVINWK